MSNQSADNNGLNTTTPTFNGISIDAQAFIYTLHALFGLVGLVIIVGISYHVYEWFQRLCIKITWPDPPPLNTDKSAETTDKKPIHPSFSNSSDCKLINESFDGDLYDDVEPNTEKSIESQRRRDGESERHPHRRRRRHRKRRRHKDNNNMLHSLRTSLAQFTVSVSRNISHKPRAPSPQANRSKQCTCCDEMIVNQNYDSVIFERQRSMTDNNSLSIKNDQSYENRANLNFGCEKNANMHTNSNSLWVPHPPTAPTSRNNKFSTLQTPRPNRTRRNVESVFSQNNALCKMVPPPLPKSKTVDVPEKRPPDETNEGGNVTSPNSQSKMLNENNLNINVVMGTDVLYQNVTVNIDTVNQSATYANEPPMRLPSAHTATPKRARKPMPMQRTFTASNKTDV